MQYSVVEYSNLNNDFRLDSEFYKFDYIIKDKEITKYNYLNLYDNKIVYITDGEHGSPDWDINSDINYVTAENIKECYIEDSYFDKISKEQDKKNIRARLQIDDILVYSVGVNAGLAAKAEPQIFPANIPRSVAILRFNNKSLSDFVAVFLNTKYGKYQTKRLQSGNAQPMLALEKIREIKIPILSARFNNYIHNINFKSYQNRMNTKNYYYQAEKLLLKGLKLNTWQPKNQLSYIKNFSETQLAGRYDAEYFKPKYDEIINYIKMNGAEKLINNFDIIRNNGLNYFEDGNIGVIKTKQLRNKFIDFSVEDNTDSILNYPNIVEKDVLFASMGVGSLGKANIFYNYETQAKSFTIDSTLKIFRQKEKAKISPELLLVFLQSKLGQELIYQNIVGSSGIISIYEDYLRELLIPIIDKDIEEKIIKNIQNAHLNNFQSKQLLQIAKIGVEKAIEENEQFATNWMNKELSNLKINL